MYIYIFFNITFHEKDNKKKIIPNNNYYGNSFQLEMEFGSFIELIFSK